MIRTRRGLTESLAGRFELLRLGHWTAAEMHAAFGWTTDQFVFHGGYPGAAPLIGEPDRWARYVRDSLIETTISRDVLLLARIEKPALLRRLFDLGCRYSGQVLSYTKMLVSRLLTAIEVKSGAARHTEAGMDAFTAAFRPDRRLLVGGDGIPVGDFLDRPVEHWVT